MLRSLLVVSDIHFAGPAETARGWHEAQHARNPASKHLVRAFRHWVWKRDPLAHNYLLDQFLRRIGAEETVVALGDYSCDTVCIGVADAASFESAQICLRQLRERCGARLELLIGDHELGKMSLVGRRGGFRWESLLRSERELHLPLFWKREIGDYLLIGVTSSLIALPVYLVETLEEERAEWWAARARHLESIRIAFRDLHPGQKVILFCHDPTALPFLLRELDVRSKLAQVEVTLIGHLHSSLFLRLGQLLAGFPRIRFLGQSIERMSAAVSEARCWRTFRVRLCPSLAGIELLKDGGYLVLELDPAARQPLRFKTIRLPWQHPRS